MKKIESKEIKKIELSILIAFADFCKQNNLRYFLYCGTLIGAVRHKGFIPWDDDVDVAMPRNDYESFKKLTMNNPINGIYEMVCYENGKSKYHYMKLVNNRTVVYEDYIKYEKDSMPTGVWIDIFPIDAMPNNKLLAYLLCLKSRLLFSLLFINITDKSTYNSDIKGILKTLLKHIIDLISPNYICKKINSTFRKYNYDTAKYVGMVCHTAAYKACVNKEVYKKTEMEFEGHLFDAPAGYDKILTQLYGDYMTVPPKEKQVQHEFEAYYKDI